MPCKKYNACYQDILTSIGTKTIMAIVLLANALPDDKTKPDHGKIVKIVPVSLSG